MTERTGAVVAGADAAALLERAVRAFNRWQRDTLALLDQTLAADPDCCLAHALKGLTLYGARNRRFWPDVLDCVDNVRRTLDAAGERERIFADALRLLVAGQSLSAAVRLETWLLTQPGDLLAHRVLQQELFWLGEAGWMRAVAERARPAWSENSTDYPGLLSVYAFSLEEGGECQAAERAGREAIARDPHEVWAAHAVAHVLEMRGETRAGTDWLQGLCANWGHANQIAHHLYWHLCLFLLETGELGRIHALLDEHVYNPEDPLVQAAPDAYIDIQNVASLLLRLELRGVDVGGRWQPLAEVAAGRIDNHISPFTSAHAAMILAATGRFEDAEELLRTLREWGRRDDDLAPRIKAAALPAAAAALAHRRGDHRRVLELLMPARHELAGMGGSHAQRDIFVQLLCDACLRLDRRDCLQILLAEQRRRGFARVEERSLYAEAAARLAA